VRVEEGVSVVMSQAAERIAQITVSVAAVRQPPPVGKTAATPEPPTGTEVSPHCSHLSAAGLSTPLPSAPATPSDASSHSRQEANASASIPSTLTTAAHSPPPVSPMIHSPLHGSQPHLTMSLLPPPIAATQSSGAMLLPFGAGNFSKVPLPPMSSGLNMFYHMPTPTLYPPNHMSSVCADCVPLGRTAHECRSILKHITPTPPSAQQPVVLAPPPMWPLAFNGVMGAVPAPVRSVPTMRAATPVTSTFDIDPISVYRQKTTDWFICWSRLGVQENVRGVQEEPQECPPLSQNSGPYSTRVALGLVGRGRQAAQAEIAPRDANDERDGKESSITTFGG
jgi:hypothetical protein